MKRYCMELLKWKWVFLPTNAQSSAWNEQLWLRILTMISVTLRNSDAITTQLLIYIVETKWDTCYTSFFIDSFQQKNTHSQVKSYIIDQFTYLLIWLSTITYWLTIINILGGGVESGEFHIFWQKSLSIGNLFKIGGGWVGKAL